MAQRPLRILCLGDSLTAGYTAYGSSFQPYHIALVSKLKDAFPSLPVEVEEDGVSGDITKNFSPRLTAEFRKTKMAKPYDWTIVLGGTNDLAYGSTPEAIFENLERTWSNAITRKSKVLALTVPEVATKFPEALARSNAKRDRLNTLIQGYTNTGFYAFDFRSAFSYTNMSEEERDRYYDDAVHFTSDGYDRMGTLIGSALVDILNKEADQSSGPADPEASPARPQRPRRPFKDDENAFEEEGGSPKILQQGYIVVRRKDLD